MFDNSFPAFDFFLRWRLVRANYFHSSGQDQSTVAQRVETTVAECSLTRCVWAGFPDGFPHYARVESIAHSGFVGSRVYACLGCPLPHALIGRMTGIFYVPLR